MRRDAVRDRVDRDLLNLLAGKDYDPNQLRDPHTGEWIDTSPGVPNVSDAQLVALQDYVTGYGVEDSNALRDYAAGGGAVSPEANERIALLTQLIDAEGEPAPTLYRVADATALEEGPSGLPQVGDYFTEHGFASAAVEEDAVYGFGEDSPFTHDPVMFKIEGARGLNINKLIKRLEADPERDIELPADVPFTEWLLKPGRNFDVLSVRHVSRPGADAIEVSVRAR